MKCLSLPLIRTLLGVSEICGQRYSTVIGPQVKLERAFDATIREYVAARAAVARG